MGARGGGSHGAKHNVLFLFCGRGGNHTDMSSVVCFVETLCLSSVKQTKQKKYVLGAPAKVNMSQQEITTWSLALCVFYMDISMFL